MRFHQFFFWTGAGAIARTFSFFGGGTGPIYLDNVACRGTESRLTDCPSFGLNNHNCGHKEDAGVTCPSKHIVACIYTISSYRGVPMRISVNPSSEEKFVLNCSKLP